MKKENLSTSMAKLIMVVSLIVGVGSIIGILGYFLMMPKSGIVIDNGTEKEKNINAQQIILFDEEAHKILKEFAKKNLLRDTEKIKIYNEILLDALEFKNGTTKEKLRKAEEDLKTWSKALEDAPDLRNFSNASTKTCIAKSIIYNDLEHTCGIKEDSSINIDGVDDLTAVEQILPYFVIGLVHYSEGNYSKANRYFNQIKLHRQALKANGYELDLPYLELYNRIYNKTLSFIKITDETANWKTYRNEEYGFEVKYPQNWNEKESPDNNTGILLLNTNKEIMIGGATPDDFFSSDGREINPKYTNDWIGIQIDVYPKPVNFSWDSWIENKFSAVEKYENYNYEGLEGIKVMELIGLFYGEPNVFIEGKKIYNIRLYNDYPYNTERNAKRDDLALNYFNQTLSTFKFIESN